MDFSFEQGPIRPPSEAKSLLIRVTRNCPWNKCAFCNSYRGRKFELRSLDEIFADIGKMKEIVNHVRELSLKLGEGGQLTNKVVRLIFGQENAYDDGFRSVAAWLYYGGQSVFIQDADSLIIKTDTLASVLNEIKSAFPFVTRITSYCRSKTASRKSVEELKRLKSAGLSRIHIGMESGYDPLLAFIRKGVTAAEHIKGGRHVVEAGLSLSEYVVPGLGGTRWTREHAEETARVLNEINPDFIRLRSLHAVPGTDLHDKILQGEFIPLSDNEVVKEIRSFLEKLEGINSTVVSDHILNLLEEVQGKLPDDKNKILAVIDRYLALSEKDQLIFRLGRRKGIYRSLDDLSDSRTYNTLRTTVEQYELREPGQLDKALSQMMHNYI
ncbi:Radical SAM superfamily protein [Syntrophus gentianae]|uniref:Radical SAM superfamily protein n=1 Tax=Syntrophus gentianae TaxID=43775 RepID=A0A1H8AQG8_9BACT|nr:radical SAM protein [Syntrophus gentianae]SEM72746.1 Radical SAM superfamily protein [Syntrophus gentianae]